MMLNGKILKLAGSVILLVMLTTCSELDSVANAAQNPAGPTQLPPISPSPGQVTSSAPPSLVTPGEENSAPSSLVVPPEGSSVEQQVNTPTESLAPVTVPPGLTLREIPKTPPGQAQTARAINAKPIKLGALIQVAALKPIAMDARFNQPISLAEALTYAREKSLPIGISKESAYYQATQLAYYFSYFLPAFSLNYAVAGSSVNGVTSTFGKLFSTGVSFPIFAGGSYLYFTLAQYYRTLGWREAYQTTVDDALLDVYNKYTNLVLNHQLLRVRIEAVEDFQDQLAQNTANYRAGSGTKFAIMQARTQLANNRQLLLAQQVATRQAALQLAYALNMPLSVNLVPTDLNIAQRPLIRSKATIEKLLSIAVRNRPDLREYEHFRLAAAKDVQIATASLYPTASIFLSFTNSNLRFSGNPSDINGLAVTQISLGGLGNGSASNTALGQTAAFSPSNLSASEGGAGAQTTTQTTNTGRTTTSASQVTALAQNATVSPGSNLTAIQGANTSAAAIVAASGGIPIATTQSGSLVTSGSVPPSILRPVSINGTSSSSNSNGSSTASFGTAPGLFNSFQSGFNLTWSLPNLGSNYVASIVATRALSRQALLQANQQVNLVAQEVRSSYLNSLAAFERIQSIGSRIDSSREALRLAELRLTTGQGTNLELISAQTEYLTSLITQVQSSILLQQAQAQLIHDLGVISINTLTQGFSPADAPTVRVLR